MQGPDAVANAIGYAEHRSRSHDAVIRVYDAAGNVKKRTSTSAISRSRSDHGLRFIVEYHQLPRRLDSPKNNRDESGQRVRRDDAHKLESQRFQHSNAGPPRKLPRSSAVRDLLPPVEDLNSTRQITNRRWR